MECVQKDIKEKSSTESNHFSTGNRDRGVETAKQMNIAKATEDEDFQRRR